MAHYVKVGSVGDLAPGHSRLVTVEGINIALFNVAGAYYALNNACTHRGGSLSDGDFNGNQVTCPLHGAVFNVITGAVVEGPATVNETCYRVRIVGNDVEVEI